MEIVKKIEFRHWLVTSGFVLITIMAALAQGKGSKDIYVEKPEEEFIKDFLPQFKKAEGYTVLKVIAYNSELAMWATEYSIEKDNSFPLSILIPDKKVWHYGTAIKAMSTSETDKFATKLKVSRKFRRVKSKVYEVLSTGEYQMYYFMKRKDSDIGVLSVFSFLPTSNPRHIQSVENIVNRIPGNEGTSEILD
jgi:hypothetical protein